VVSQGDELGDFFERPFGAGEALLLREPDAPLPPL